MQTSVIGTLIAGHQIASGTNSNSPYPAGSIAMQLPKFKALGLDLSDCFAGTLNLQFAVNSVEIIKPDFTFEDVLWAEGFMAETFSFIGCEIALNNRVYKAWVYYPHPETKLRHFQQTNVLEILTLPIQPIRYGEQLEFHFDADKIAFHN
ncbi:hypothetical protein [Aliiglaciecola sp. LCG003]|uniref:hypothetical protein n=1 Tax=Aliiglaciecola sp. LCG003 TaxID=3053655 RepID=UPI002574745A|nr:hypothetical protein [Aliiglaciecola sp. LCG003]WJG09765.1 hypothetical protein QR722_01620 [Aliiglaciecola sp. LCG003]